MKLSPEILDLGRALVAHLGLDERNDLLARWMAHDIAGKIDFAERHPQDAAAQAACSDAILRLWEHRAVFPHTKRPFESLEPLLQTLERLDPDCEAPLYFRPDPNIQGEAASWLKAAVGFDTTARILISYVLGVAAGTLGHAASDWSDLAEAAGLRGPDVDLTREIFRAPGTPELTPGEAHRKNLTRLVERLKAFEKTTKLVAKALNADLAALDSPGSAGGGDLPS